MKPLSILENVRVSCLESNINSKGGKVSYYSTWEFGEFPFSRKLASEPFKGPPSQQFGASVEMPYIAIHNTLYQAGLAESKAVNGEYTMNGLVQYQNNTNALNKHFLRQLSCPILHTDSFHDVISDSSTIVSLIDIDEVKEIASVNFAISDDISNGTYKVVFDLKNGMCRKQEYVSTEGIKYEFEAKYGDSLYPMTIQTFTTSKSKRRSGFEWIILDEPESVSISDATTWLTFYGLPEPDFVVDQQSSLWFRVAVIICILVAIAVGVLYLRNKKS